MDRDKPGKPRISTEMQGALLGVVMLGAALTPLLCNYRDKYLSKPQSPETPTPTPIIDDTEAAKRQLITGGQIPSPEIQISPSPSSSPHVSFE